MWLSGLFLLLAMPLAAAGILYSLSKSIRSGYMVALRVVNNYSPSTPPASSTLQDSPVAFGMQAFLLGAVAGLCMYFACVAAYHLLTAFKRHPDYPHPHEQHRTEA